MNGLALQFTTCISGAVLPQMSVNAFIYPDSAQAFGYN